GKEGGRFIVRGGKFETLEGQWHPKRLVVLEFPSVEQAKRWYDSEEYRPLKAMRFKASKSNLVLVEGGFPREIPPSHSPPRGAHAGDLAPGPRHRHPFVS